MAARHAATSCPEQRGSDPQGPPQRREALGRGPPRNRGVAPPLLGTLTLPFRTAQYAAGPRRPPAAPTTGRRCLCNGLRVPLSSNAREIVGADRRAQIGFAWADRGAIVLRTCRPLVRPLRVRRIARTGPASVRSRGGQDERHVAKIRPPHARRQRRLAGARAYKESRWWAHPTSRARRGSG